MKNLTIEKRGKGRPKMNQAPVVTFDPKEVKIVTGGELKFADSLFQPMKTDTVFDTILSTNGGLMPATNMIICGGPGSGKSTIVLDALSRLAKKGKKVLFVSGEMDEIGHYKYCRRMPQFKNVKTLFLKNYTTTIKQAIEHVFDMGWDVVAIDSIAEVIEMYKDTYKTTESAAELWLLDLQTKHKKGDNKGTKYTAFVNIQQVTKAGDFAGSNRLKHMTDAMCHVTRIKDSADRKVHFSKNRDCDTDNAIMFRIGLNQVEYSFEAIENDSEE